MCFTTTRTRKEETDEPFRRFFPRNERAPVCELRRIHRLSVFVRRSAALRLHPRPDGALCPRGREFPQHPLSGHRHGLQPVRKAPGRFCGPHRAPGHAGRANRTGDGRRRRADGSLCIPCGACAPAGAGTGPRPRHRGAACLCAQPRGKDRPGRDAAAAARPVRKAGHGRLHALLLCLRDPVLHADKLRFHLPDHEPERLLADAHRRICRPRLFRRILCHDDGLRRDVARTGNAAARHRSADRQRHAVLDTDLPRQAAHRLPVRQTPGADRRIV